MEPIKSGYLVSALGPGYGAAAFYAAIKGKRVTLSNEINASAAFA